MGANSSQHEPLDTAVRLPSRDKLRRSARMDKLRRSFRDSFRKKKEHIPESSKPHQWQSDEGAVRGGTCSFHVKYLGCVEVYESRGMQICEEALKVLRSSRRRPERGMLYVSGDGLRFVDDDTKGLIVDQTIEKVSFCAPDRNHERGFSYICRDGTTRRWMCHGFLASRDTGERLSHAVGCAFAVCLEKKQKRDEKCGVTMTFDNNSSTFTRKGSFRTLPLVERIQDPPEGQKIEAPTPSRNVANPFAIERPHATPLMLQRQNSFRGFSTLNQQSPFKRQLSLRLNDLPSTLDRQRGPDSGPGLIPEGQIPSPIHPNNAVSLLAQQVSQGLSLLASVADSQGLDSPTSQPPSKCHEDQLSSISPDNNPWSGMTAPGWSAPFKPAGQNPPGSVPVATVQPTPVLPPASLEITKLSKAEEWLSNTVKLPPAPSPAPRKNPPVSVRSQSLQARPPMNPFSGPDWLQQSQTNSQPPSNPFSQNTVKAFEVHM